jgi:hypothetical protein
MWGYNNHKDIECQIQTLFSSVPDVLLGKLKVFTKYSNQKKACILTDFNNVVLYLLIQSRHAGVAQLVEHNLAKVGVAGSNPVSRSIYFQ